VVWPFALVSGVLGAVAVDALFSGMRSLDPLQFAAVGVITGLLTVFALTLAFRPKAPGSVAVSTIGWTLFFAVLNSPFCFVVLELLSGQNDLGRLVSGFFLATLYGLFFSLPLGGAWATALVGPMYVVARLRQQPSLDGPDRAARAVGGTIAVVATLGTFITIRLDTLPAALAAIALAGTLVALVSSLRLAYLSRFLRQVRQGQREGWTIVALRDLDDGYDEAVRDLPVTHLDRHPDAVLFRTLDARAKGAYRTASPTQIAWARTAA
jgi:hypothetical protein